VKRVVLMVDGSREAANAARWCGEHLEAGTEVVAVTTVSPFGAFMLGLPPSRGGDWMPDIRRALDGPWTEPLRAAHLAYRTMLLEENPVGALLDMARREDADAIVVGKSAHGFLSEHLLGGVAADLLHHSSLPIIVVPL
jgi:nucleotide-binding universal stress UspA family protein